jgi:aspartate-semialdehyde dehydrogenase
VAVVGGDSLLAKELREQLRLSEPAPRIELISSTADGSSVLGADHDEPIVMSPLTALSLAGSRVAFLAGSHASSRRTLKVNPPDGPVLIDLLGALEDQPEARLRAPQVEATRQQQPNGTKAAKIQVIAHPAAIALAILLSRLAQCGRITRSLVHVFEPASERGQPGLDELHQQTVAVLAFKKLKMDVFDAQLGFNLLARYGEEAPVPFQAIELRLERNLASLLAAYPAIPMPSVRLIQAPVFHGHSFSVWVEFEDAPNPKEISKSLAAAGIDVRPDDPPTNVGTTGESGLSVGAIGVDRNQPRACWMWMVADNLRMTVENALATAKESL